MGVFLNGSESGRPYDSHADEETLRAVQAGAETNEQIDSREAFRAKCCSGHCRPGRMQQEPIAPRSGPTM